MPLYIRSQVWQILTDFHNFFTVVFSIKFTTKGMSYISPCFKGVTPLLCKTQKTETGKFSYTQRSNSCLMFTKLTNMPYMELTQMLKISCSHTNTHKETFAPLITCVIDDTDGEKCSSRSTKFTTSMNWRSAWLMSDMILSKALPMCESMKF